MTTSHSAVKIVWHDAHSVTDGWVLGKNIENTPCVVESVGWLIENKVDNHLVIAQSWIASNDEDEYDGVLSIPLGMVVSVEILSGGQEKLF
ncbi:MAG: hypothetical protein EBU84_07420 [Actinobacteria bacterium]|nr:hypothetical protein [Actinomycetota bacterium]